MKYLDLFTGIGGFTLALENAMGSTNRTKDSGGKEDPQRAPEKEREGLVAEEGEGASFEGGRDSEHDNIGANEGAASCVGFSEIDRFASAIYKFHYPNHNELGDITKIDTATLPDFDLLMGGFPCQSFSIAGKRRGFDDTRGTLFFEVARILRDKRPKYFLLENVKGLLSHDGGKTFSTIIEVLQEIGYGVSWKVLNTKDFGIPQNRERVFIFGVRGECPREILPLHQTTSSSIKIVGRGKHQQDQVHGTDGIMSTLAAGTHGSTPHLTKTLTKGKIRRLTPTECAHLQGFPDNWCDLGNYDGEIKEVSDSQKYKCCGNAVTVKVVEEVLKSVL